MKRHKYGVSKPEDRTWRGRVFDSKAEMRYAQIVELDSTVRHVAYQPSVVLSDAGVRYRPDLLIVRDSGVEYVDVKGMVTERFRVIVALWEQYGPADLRIVKASGKGFKTEALIQPRC